ncbi:MAG: hypothetical protein LBT43_03315 [Prevotella sp.]|jgi:hypothetical protein|nr:hypothetical protein [Prevotella sp.]
MKTKLILYCSLFCFFLPGCEDIFLKDISNEQVVVISPVADTFFEEGKVLFAWDRIKGAEKYYIEVASPSFDRSSLLYDTITDTTRVELSLSEGKYQWSIYGYNSGYKSKKIIHSFEIKKDEE